MATPASKPTDQLAKTHLVLITAVLALVGFVLEIGPVAGVFPFILVGLALELSTLGFLPYLALAASAAVGLHLSEEEPTAREKKPETPEAPQPTPEGEMVGQRVRVRPDLHQMRMIFTAIGGYAVLKGLNLALMWPLAPNYNISQAQLINAFEFGFVYVALGWLVMWQFLRWYAQRRKWVRLQEELVGGNVTQVVALFILIKPLINIGTVILQRITPNPQLVIAILLNLAVIAGAWLLWTARPVTMRRTVVGLLTVSGVIILLTVIRAVLEPR
ncbi:MAG: hypothetical protein ACYDCO_18895 [Armatimonadota bacterium]